MASFRHGLPELSVNVIGAVYMPIGVDCAGSGVQSEDSVVVFRPRFCSSHNPNGGKLVDHSRLAPPIPRTSQRPREIIFSMTRRDFLAATALAAFAPTRQDSELAVEGYIFQQYAQKLNKPLEAVLPEVLAMPRAAGFTNIELNSGFFPSGARERTLSIIQSQHLRMPSLYVGGALHEKTSADKTISDALEFGDLCQPFGCKAIVTNPDPKHGNVEKTDSELDAQADSLNRMGRTLSEHGFQLRVHHHTPQLINNAREWRHILAHTDPEYVYICVDVDWAYEAGFAPIPFLREVENRLREIHVRSARQKIWLEDLEDSDIDYRAVATYLKQANLNPLIVVELAYRPNTLVTRSLVEDLRLSRQYAERVFGVQANA